MEKKDFKIGFIGIGTMGIPMVSNLLRKTKQKIAVYDVNPEQAKKIENLGAVPKESIEEVGRCSNLIFIIVPNNEHVLSVVNALKPVIKQEMIICNCSSISPSVQRECAQIIESTGGHSMEAPVVKSKNAAVNGTLGIYTAGPKEIVDQVVPFLLLMGEKVIYYGSHGNAMTMKIIHNMLVGNIQNGVNEMFVMADAVGLDFDSVMEGIRAGGGQNFYLDVKGPTIKAGDYEPKFSIRNMTKDVNLHGMLKEELNLHLPGSDIVREIYQEAVKTIPDEDFSATYKVVKKNSQIK